MGAPGVSPRRIAPAELLAVGFLIVVAAFIYTHFALRVGGFQNDEEQYLSLARFVADNFPGSLFHSNVYPRGPQRLDAWIMAIAFASGRGPNAYAVAHVLQAVMFASAALPVFLIARRTGLGALWSLFAAVLSIVVPWAIVATSFLAESAAYPAYAWVLCTSWMAVVHPSRGREALVLLALLAAVLSRTAMLALVPLLPLAVLWQEWSQGLHEHSRAERARRLPGRIATRHPLSAVMIVVGALALIGDRLSLLPGQGLRALAGGYGVPVLEPVGNILHRFRQYIARAAVGTGFFAVTVALPWTLATLIRPRDRERHATAVICTLGAGAILLSLLQAGLDERYIAYLAVPISVAAATALSDLVSVRPGWRSLAGLLAGAAVVLALITSSEWPPVANAYDFFSYPSAIFYQRVLLARASTMDIPLLHPSAEALIAAVVVIGVLAFAASLRIGRTARVAPAFLGVALIGVCLTQSLYAMKKFTALVGAGGPNGAERSWVDAHVPPDASVGALGLSMGAGPSYLPIWRDTEFWNTSVKLDLYFGLPGSLPLPLGTQPVALSFQPQTGLLSGTANGRSWPLPKYVLIPAQGTNSLGLHATLVARSTFLPLILVKLGTPARIDWNTTGTSEEGFMTADSPVTALVYNRAAREVTHPCATFSLLPPPAFTGSWPFTVTRGGRVVSRGVLTGKGQVNLAIGLAPVTGPTTTLTVTVHSHVAGPGGSPYGARFAFFTIAACPAHHS